MPDRRVLPVPDPGTDPVDGVVAVDVVGREVDPDPEEVLRVSDTDVFVLVLVVSWRYLGRTSLPISAACGSASSMNPSPSSTGI